MWIYCALSKSLYLFCFVVYLLISLYEIKALQQDVTGHPSHSTVSFVVGLYCVIRYHLWYLSQGQQKKPLIIYSWPQPSLTRRNHYLFGTPAVSHRKKPYTIYSVPQPSATRRNRSLFIPYPSHQPPEETVHYLFHTPAISHQKKPYTIYSVPQPSATRRNRTLFIPYPSRQLPGETVHYLIRTPATRRNRTLFIPYPSHQPPEETVHYLFHTPAISHQKKPSIILGVV